MKKRGCLKMKAYFNFETASLINLSWCGERLEIEVILSVVVADVFYHLADARHF